jgi:hypothetical protein
MAAQRVFHWKHGWIPLDRYAELEKGSGRKSAATGAAGKLDAAREAYIGAQPHRQWMREAAHDAQNKKAAQARVDKLRQFLPAELTPSPHKQASVRNFELGGTIPAHHTGDIVFSRAQTRALVRWAAQNNEGGADRVDAAEASGQGARIVSGSHGPEAEAKANARLLKSLLGLSQAPLAHLPSKNGATGGIQVPADLADELAARLGALHTGMATSADVARAGGSRR